MRVILTFRLQLKRFINFLSWRYGPNHIEMSKKLLQMNKVIEDVIKKIDNNTILLVLGDHGNNFDE